MKGLSGFYQNYRNIYKATHIIAAIRTLAVQVSQLSIFLLIPLLFFQQIQCLGQHIEYFEKIQIECSIITHLVIPLYSNIRWGSTYNMLDHAYRLRQVCQTCITFKVLAAHTSTFQPLKLFIATADELYKAMTVIHHNSYIFKKIPWSAFKFSETDWIRVLDAKSILEVSCQCYLLDIAYIEMYRTPIRFNNTSPLNGNPHYGMCSPQLRSFKQHGKKNVTSPNMHFTRLQLTMA